jgi:hypothetical protein
VLCKDQCLPRGKVTAVTDTDAQPTEAPSTGSMPPTATIRQRTLVIGASAIGVLLIAVAVVLGLLWSSANADLADARYDLEASQSELADVQQKLDVKEADLTKSTTELRDLWTDSMYTACVQYYGGYALGTGIDAATAVRLSTESCAAESARTFDIKTAP